MATIRPELLSATDSTIEDAVAHADPMLLRGLLYLATGDESLTSLELARLQIGNFFASRIASEADAASVRVKAADLLKAYRDGGPGEALLGPPERLYRPDISLIEWRKLFADLDIPLKAASQPPGGPAVTNSPPP